MSTDIVVSSFSEAREVYRQRDLRQGLYDAGAVVMDGVLVNLHGEEHKKRRRVENRIFRRDTFDHYENEMFPGIVDTTFAPHGVAGHTDLIDFGHELMLNLAALTAGIDRPRGDAEETARLHEYVKHFIEGATLVHSTLDRDARSALISDQLRLWEADFLAPSIERRRALLEHLENGTTDASELPRDILTALLRNRSDLDLDWAVLTREIAFFLLAGAHTSATAFTRTIDHMLSWLDAHPEDTGRASDDLLFIQRCVHETIRLNPSSPTGMRRALTDVDLASGRAIPEGALVVIDLEKVNRDVTVFGDDAADFDPYRTLPDGVAPFGLSFAAGMHVCIGQDLAGGVVPPVARSPYRTATCSAWWRSPCAGCSRRECGAIRIIRRRSTKRPSGRTGRSTPSCSMSSKRCRKAIKEAFRDHPRRGRRRHVHEFRKVRRRCTERVPLR